jgi:type I restriction enzyme S subunit
MIGQSSKMIIVIYVQISTVFLGEILSKDLQKFPLSDVIKILKGRKVKNLFEEKISGSTPYILIPDLLNGKPTHFTTDTLGQECYSTDVLIAWDGATVGKSGFGFSGYAGSTIGILRPDQNLLYPNYLAKYIGLKRNELNTGKGGSAIPHINRNQLENLQIPLPPLEIQKKMADILEKADRAREKRKEANKLTEQYLQSAFIEMFGDPFINPKNWKFYYLKDISNKITDGVHLKPTYQTNGVPFISVKDITTGELKFEHCKYITKEDHNSLVKRCKPEYLDILYTKVGATYGRSAIVNAKRQFSIYVSVALIKPNKNIVNPYYLNEVLKTNYVKGQADKRVKGMGVPDLHLIEIKDFSIPVPPLSEQQKFADLVEKIQKLKEKQRKSEQEIENLFHNLMQKAFKGELV